MILELKTHRGAIVKGRHHTFIDKICLGFDQALKALTHDIQTTGSPYPAETVGDDWSLGFVVETEKQVIKHLEGHLKRLPAQDVRSAAILKRMEQDEAHHRDEAKAAGARELPLPVKVLMRMMSKVMVKTVYFV